MIVYLIFISALPQYNDMHEALERTLYNHWYTLKEKKYIKRTIKEISIDNPTENIYTRIIDKEINKLTKKENIINQKISQLREINKKNTATEKILKKIIDNFFEIKIRKEDKKPWSLWLEDKLKAIESIRKNVERIKTKNISSKVKSLHRYEEKNQKRSIEKIKKEDLSFFGKEINKDKLIFRIKIKDIFPQNRLNVKRKTQSIIHKLSILLDELKIKTHISMDISASCDIETAQKYAQYNLETITPSRNASQTVRDNTWKDTLDVYKENIIPPPYYALYREIPSMVPGESLVVLFNPQYEQVRDSARLLTQKHAQAFSRALRSENITAIPYALGFLETSEEPASSNLPKPKGKKSDTNNIIDMRITINHSLLILNIVKTIREAFRISALSS